MRPGCFGILNSNRCRRILAKFRQHLGNLQLKLAKNSKNISNLLNKKLRLVLFPTLFSTSDSKLSIGEISKLSLLLDLDVNTKLEENSTAGELATAGAGDTRDFTSDHESIDPWRPRGCAIFWLAKTNGTELYQHSSAFFVYKTVTKRKKQGDIYWANLQLNSKRTVDCDGSFLRSVHSRCLQKLFMWLDSRELARQEKMKKNSALGTLSHQLLR